MGASVRFAFAADTHIQSEEERDWLIQDLKFIQDVDFIIMGGALTGYGKKKELSLKYVADFKPFPSRRFL